jgi:hypothetical protein
MRGLAIERAPGSDRWLVQLEDGSLKSVREAHIVRQSVHSDGSVRDGADGDGGIEAAIVAAQPQVPVYIYEASGHGFNNDGRPDSDPDDAKLARERTLDLFMANGAG